MADANVWTVIGLVAGPSITAWGVWQAARHKGRSEAVEAQAALLKVVQDGAKDMIAALEARVAGLQSRVDSVESQLTEERQAWRQERHDLAERASNAEARAHFAERACQEGAGERRQLQQLIDSLTRLLREHGIPLPAPVRTTEPVLLGEELPALDALAGA